MMKKLLLLIFLISITGFTALAQESKTVGHTEITKWQYGKSTAISLTYDDGTINQFRVAIPIMNKRGLPGTFYVITGTVPGSQFSPKFIGRPVDEIIAETAEVPTNKNNFFERASAVRFLGYKGTYAYHNQAGSQFEQGNIREAYRLMDEAYKKVRNGAFETSNDSLEARKALYDVLFVDPGVDLVTWDQLRKYQSNGHEIGSHTVSHPYLAVMDSVNLMYELKKSKEDIRKQLGHQATFTAECPFGTEDERVMEYAHTVYPALRNRMPEHYLKEIRRSRDEDPTRAEKE
jgi:peptidoglycan/xylan/chitin deacetylase (PgdA/CDA1 family)